MCDHNDHNEPVTFINRQCAVPPSGLRGCRRFQSSAVNYSSMLLEADSQRLYVGARGAAFALNASDISAAGSALTVSPARLFLPRCVLHLPLSATASFAFHNIGTSFSSFCHFEEKEFIPPSPPCGFLCVCV